ncbi:MAG: hypothetical protein KJ718_02480 [Nanoarchaeota archaeon]|nr:hypothetical protein [Nanoarchaeota archaeon]MBU1051397.1 hypothetical protein [Nanoarchaeota archaeon]MBU1988600.1 hypothetical protein [Nanoarchaeota archaeon]
MWNQFEGVNVRSYDGLMIEAVVAGVGEFIRGTKHRKIVHSTDLETTPRVTALTLGGEYFLLSESVSGYGNEGVRVGTQYTANVYCPEDRSSLSFSAKLKRIVESAQSQSRAAEVPA